MASTLTKLLFHFVFSTKERTGLITDELESNLYPYIGGVIRGERGDPIAIGGTKDHLHILAGLPTTISIAEMLRRIKGNSSKWVGDQYRFAFAWQRGYAAFSVSQSLAGKVRRYVQNQKEHHKKVPFQDELILLLDKHGVEYDQRYIWD
ncbi:MAG: transposase [Gammaproteobacteria bacterium]|nr:MAG: transposase [Gammaproteobacteria bacterium]